MHRHKFVLGGLIAATLFLAGMLGLIPGIEPFLVRADSVNHYSLLAETMQPIDSSIGFNSHAAYLTTTQNSTVNGVTQYIGQVNLPDGATITGVRCFGNDTDPAGQFQFALFRYRLSDSPVYSQVTDLVLSGYAWNDGKHVWSATVDGDLALVDNEQYSYGMYLVLPEASDPSYDLGVLRFVIDSSYSTALPLVMNGSSSP